jgi:NTE family protein
VASASCFPAARYAEIGDKKFVDGGYADNMPVKMALDRGAERIIAVDLDAVGRMNKAVIETVEEKDQDFTIVSSSWDLGNWLSFEPEAAARNIRLGYLDGMKALSLLDGEKFTFKKDEFEGEMLTYADRAAEVFSLDPEVIHDEENMREKIGAQVRDSQLQLRSKSVTPRVPSGKIDPKEILMTLHHMLKDYAAEVTTVYIAESIADYGTKSVFNDKHVERLLKKEVGAARFILAKGLLAE